MEEVDNWRSKPIRDRLAFALTSQTQICKDLSFIVGKEEEVIGAHKVILQLSSLVFDKLIQNFDDLEMSSISLPNVTPKMFKRLLKFIYTDELEMHDFVEFLKVADEFGFTQLTKNSLEVLKKMKITESNVVFILKIAKDLLNLELEQRCLIFIQKNADVVLKSESFVHISYVGLCQVLLDDKLVDVDELTIFRSVVRWGNFFAKQRMREGKEINLRDALLEARFHIRYTEIPYENLLSEVKGSGILSSSEFIQTLKTFIDPTDNPLGLITRPRFHQRLKKDLKLERAPTKKRNISEVSSSSQIQQSFVSQPAPVNHNMQVSSAPLPIQRQHEMLPHQDMMYPPAQQLIPPPLIYPAENYPQYQGPQVLPFNENPDQSSSPNECHIQNCLIDYNNLLSTVQLKETTLRRIIFNNVTILNNNLSRANRVYLPHLESFQFYQDLDQDPNCTLPDKSFMNGLTMREFLFFEKTKKSWMMRNLLSLGVFVSIEVKGITLFEINPMQDKVLMAFPDQIEADFILENCSVLKTLCLIDCDIKNPQRIPVELLVNLILQSCNIKNMSLMRFINKCKNLKNLSINEKTKQIAGFQVHFASDLKNCKHTLERLSISNANLYGWSMKNSSKSPAFSSLQELYFNHCDWTGQLLSNYFKEKFPILKRFGIRSKDACRPSASFLREVLQIETLELVAIFRYPGLDDTHKNPNLDIFNTYGSTKASRAEDKQFIHEFLQSSGLEFPLIGPGIFDVPDFLLKRDFTTDGLWHASWNFEELEQIHFNFSMLNEVFADISVTHKLQ